MKNYDFANSTAPLVFVCANETAENGETRDDDTTLHFDYAFLFLPHAGRRSYAGSVPIVTLYFDFSKADLSSIGKMSNLQAIM